MSTRTANATLATSVVVLPRVNLLPREIGDRRRFRQVQAGMGAGVLVALAVVGALVVVAAGAVSDAQSEADAASGRQVALQRQVTSYRDVVATYKRATDAQAMLVAAMGEEVRYSRFLDDMSRTLPAGVWTKNVAFSQTAPTTTGAGSADPGIGTLSVTGVAYSYTDVASWLETLAAQDGMATPVLQTSTESLLAKRRVVNWTATVPMSPAALSGRYTKAGN